MIIARRAAEQAAQIAETVNRFRGSGGGAGMAPLTLVIDQDTGVINQTYTGIGIANAVDITNSSATVQVSNTCRLFYWGQVDFANNAGNTDYVYVYCDVDGALTGRRLFVGTAFEAVCETLIIAPLLGPGLHTVKLRGYVGAGGNTGICYAARMFGFLAGI